MFLLFLCPEDLHIKTTYANLHDVVEKVKKTMNP